MEIESVCLCETIKLHDGISCLLLGERCKVLVFVTCTQFTGVDIRLTNQRVCFFSPNAIIDAATLQ
jgi:hypothetical protein